MAEQTGESVRALAELRNQLGSQLFNEQVSRILDEESLAKLHAKLDTQNSQQSSGWPTNT